MSWNCIIINQKVSVGYSRHFSYDPHGNVNEAIHEIPELEHLEQDIKRVEYDYELASGNVTNVFYQRDSLDMFMHHYEYDADNRLKEVFTSADSVIFDRDGKYFYYDHGPLARTEVGNLKTQGIDYVYSIHGWLKGINSNTLDSTRDVGNDAATGYLANNDSIHRKMGRDAYGYTLGYFEGDFNAISEPSTTANFEADITSSGLLSAGASLYNGNISHQVTAIEDYDIHGYAYTYDQLNRIKEAEAFSNLTESTNTWGAGSGLTEYKTEYTYDPNGNILSLLRNGSSTQTNMDDFTYNYISGTNQLEYVDDAVAGGNYSTDIDDQSAGNYTYDEIGNLYSDAAEGIDSIKWTVYGKVDTIFKSSGEYLTFEYDAAGNRYRKAVHHTNDDVDYTYYLRDAQGNILGTYDRTYDDDLSGTYSVDDFTIETHDIYGSSRLGSDKTNEHLSQYLFDKSVQSGDVTLDTLTRPERALGSKHYEHTNHLGNVYLTFTDKRIEQDPDANDTISYYTADISSKQDYYGFGSLMPERNSTSSLYNYGFGGQLKDDEIANQTGANYSAMFWEYDSRLGRRWNRDVIDFPWLSDYAAFNNNPILYADPSGAAPTDESGGNGGGDNTLGKDLNGSSSGKRDVSMFKKGAGDVKKEGFVKRVGNTLKNAANKITAAAKKVAEVIDKTPTNKKPGNSLDGVILTDPQFINLPETPDGELFVDWSAWATEREPGLSSGGIDIGANSIKFKYDGNENIRQPKKEDFPGQKIVINESKIQLRPKLKPVTYVVIVTNVTARRNSIGSASSQEAFKLLAAGEEDRINPDYIYFRWPAYGASDPTAEKGGWQYGIMIPKKEEKK